MKYTVLEYDYDKGRMNETGTMHERKNSKLSCFIFLYNAILYSYILSFCIHIVIILVLVVVVIITVLTPAAPQSHVGYDSMCAEARA